MKLVDSTHFRSIGKKREIIQAALKCFSEKGYTETSMLDICSRAKASTGSVYHHYKSKEQLAAAVYLEGIKEYQTGLIKNLEKQKDGFRGISSIIRYHLNWIVKNPEWSSFLFQKRHYTFLNGANDQLNVLNINFSKKVIGWFVKHIEKGTFRPLPWEIIIAMVFGPCQEYARLYYSGKANLKIEQAVRNLSDVVWRALASEKKWGKNYERN
ncbi:MAG: TetR/AcrR family transcriptional regulator [Smithella sp.]|nr:TetR/AcrR family transcriptional regulator [Smithella sp.]